MITRTRRKRRLKRGRVAWLTDRLFLLSFLFVFLLPTCPLHLPNGVPVEASFFPVVQGVAAALSAAQQTPILTTTAAAATTTTTTTSIAQAYFRPGGNVTQVAANQKPQDARRRQKVKLPEAQGNTKPLIRSQPQAQSQQQQPQVGRGGNLWRPTKKSRQQQQAQEQPQRSVIATATTTTTSSSNVQQDQSNGGGGLQVSITPRVSLVRVPVESNTILKCLISAQSDNFTKPFKIRWSRFMHDENAHEQIESSSGFDDEFEQQQQRELAASHQSKQTPPESTARPRDKRQEEPASAPPAGNGDSLPAVGVGAPLQASAGVDGQQEEQPVLLLNRQHQLRDFLARSRQETNVISNILIEAALSISPVKASDNATYYCTATDGLSDQNQARIDLLALSRPVVRLDRVRPARDSKSALIHWTILSDGNTPIKRTILMVRNESDTSRPRAPARSSKFPSSALFDSNSDQLHQQQQQQHSSIVLDSERNEWQRIDILGDGLDQEQQQQVYGPSRPLLPEEGGARADVDITSLGGSLGGGYSSVESAMGWRPRPPSSNPFEGPRSASTSRRPQRAFNLTALLPGLTYQLRLAAINDMGHSDWSQLQATMPNEIPAQISDIVVLSAANDSITIGWRRPPYDNAKTIRYEMQLFDLNRTLTLDANTNTNPNSSTSRTNFMFHFVNLNPGTDYHFHIRACSKAGCSAYSSPKLLASTLDGEPDEPLDVELLCGHSSPSAAASLNGAPAPSTGQTGGGLSVSWLPPTNVRGKLLNYSVTIESSARYRNQSGQWVSEQLLTTLDTGDNHTLSLEASSLLAPNTNYSARVCANNRARRCGRPSQPTARSQCSTPPELLAELPADIQLGLKQFRLTDVDQVDSQQVETLVLEMPFISWRNGPIDCIQVVLVRLPAAYDSSRARPLSEFLPDDPAQLELHEYSELLQSQQSPSNAYDASSPTSSSASPQSSSDESASKRAFAYLAEELNQINQSGQPEEIARGMKQILLGDGVQANCNSIWAQMGQQQAASSAPKRQRTRPIDGALSAQTYYTGFLRLVQLRRRRHASQAAANRERRQLDDGVELLTKYSNYFSPVTTGERVPEVAVSSLGASMSDDDQTASSSGAAANESICGHNLVLRVQEKLGATNRTCLAMVKFADSTRRAAARWLRQTSRYVLEKLRRIKDEKHHEPDPMQPLELGLLIMASSLFLLLIVYLLILPSRIGRRRRLKMKRQLLQHEAHVAQQQQQQQQHGHLAGGLAPDEMKSPQVLNEQIVHSKSQLQQLQQLDQFQAPTQNLQALASSLGYQQVPPSTGANGHSHQSPQVSTLRRSNHECPVHSSPMSQLSSRQDYQAEEEEEEAQELEEAENEQVAGASQFAAMQTDRRQSVHVCQPASRDQRQQQQQPVYGHHSQAPNEGHHHVQHHHHGQRHGHTAHHHHHQSAYQLGQDDAADYSASVSVAAPTAADRQLAMGDYERNCRTMTRRQLADHSATNGYGHTAHNVNYNTMQRQQPFAQQQQMINSSQNVAYGMAQLQQTALRQQQQHYNMTMQHNSVLSLAKKVSKSIPLSLFLSVLEIRLKNGWLREEYEQLPRLALSQQQQQQPPPSSQDDGRHVKLRPQLIVSRDDSVSALISGNDHYAGSLIKLQVPVSLSSSKPTGQIQPAQSSGGGGPVVEKQFICAKSPTDPDSVWDFWRLIYEKDVNTLVMLTPNEDVHTGELRCAQYWPTCDNEETTILSPCNESVQQSSILPAKFKIRQETLSLNLEGQGEEFVMRRLTLLVMATKPDENEMTNAPTTPTTNEDNTSKLIGGSAAATNATTATATNNHNSNINGATQQDASSNSNNNNNNNPHESPEEKLPPPPVPLTPDDDELQRGGSADDDEDRLVIVERDLLHFQFLHWNASSSSNQLKLIKFVELVNERHARLMQQQASPGTNWQQISPQNPILVHCANGLGRSGLFTAMSFVIEDLSYKLALSSSSILAARANNGQRHSQQQVAAANAKLNLYQVVARLRNQCDMLLSPYRFYELLYQLTAKCIPAHTGTLTPQLQRQHQHHNHQQHQQQQQQLQHD